MAMTPPAPLLISAQLTTAADLHLIAQTSVGHGCLLSEPYRPHNSILDRITERVLERNRATTCGYETFTLRSPEKTARLIPAICNGQNDAGRAEDVPSLDQAHPHAKAQLMRVAHRGAGASMPRRPPRRLRQ